MVWHNAEKEQVAKELDSQPKKGLNDLNAGVRRAAFGVNTVVTAKKRSGLAVFTGKLLSPLSLILIVFSAVSVAVNMLHYRAGTADMPSLVFNLAYAGALMLITVIIDTVRSARELSANSTIADIKRSALKFVRVRRNGLIKEILTEELVPGDIIQIEVGDIIPADGRLLITRSFMCDERVLTGDDTPALKDSGAVLPEDTPLSQRRNMAYAGTVAVTGRAVMIVTETGSRTMIAKKHGRRQKFISNRTPLVKNAGSIRSFGIWLVLCTLISVLSIYALGLDISSVRITSDGIRRFVTENFEVIPDYLRAGQGHSGGSAVFDGIVFFLTLMLCTVPIGLPQNVMRSIAKGIAALRRDGFMLHRFKKTEIIGCTSVICTDKSGTLTHNSLRLVRAWPAGDSSINVSEGFWSDDMKYLMRCSALCCDHKFSADSDAENDTVSRDGIDAAIVSAYSGNGGDILELLRDYPRHSEIPFDGSRRMMTVIYNVNGVFMSVTKGAPETLISRCLDVDRDEIERRAGEMFAEGLTVIAVAVQTLDQLPPKITPESVEHDLSFIGLLGFADACRDEAGDAVNVCNDAGIRTVMITGDHPETAASLARRLNILPDGGSVLTGDMLAGMSDETLANDIEKYSVFARITPEDKVRIIRSWQSRGACVLMTAGGMTDAPALHRADVSCSAESTATDVAADAADITLADSSFVSLSSMIRHGRRIRKNLRNLTEFSITCAIAETLLIVAGGLIFHEIILSLLPLALLNLMLFLFVQPCFADEPADRDIMKKMPDENTGILIGRFESYRVWLASIYIVFNSVIAYMIGNGYFLPDKCGQRTGVTMAFAAMSLSLLLHAFCTRSEKPLACAGIFRNYKLLLGILFTAAAIALMIALPWVAALTGFAALSLRQWCVVGALLLIQLLVWEYPKLYVLLKFN